MNNNIEQLVDALPEKYQPIFGHPEISNEASRACEDRLVVIRETHDALQALIDRPLRVLDLGCAQGYFSLSLAAAGAEVLGIDYLPANVAVCEALANERTDLKARFQVGRIEDVIERIQPGEFDLVLGLSVFHHVIYEKGIHAVKKLLNTAAESVGCLLLEIALKREPLYWGPSQPDDPRELLADMAFSHQLALHPTHLANIPRPMFLASNCYWIFDGQAQKILSWSTEPHQLAGGTHQGTRRYYWSEKHFAKLNRIDCDRGEHNLREYLRELEFLKNVPQHFKAPRLYCNGQNQSEAWIVQERLNGKLLSELLIKGEEFDALRVLRSVLEQLSLLETAGWYHNDIRTWNALIQDDGSALLIDFGSLLHKPEDCVWPNNIFLAFLIFVYEVATRNVDLPMPLRAVAMSPGRFPAPYNDVVRRIWDTPAAQWSFTFFRGVFDEIDLAGATAIQPYEAWSTAIELGMHALSLNQYHLGLKVHQAEARAEYADARAQQVESRTEQAESRAEQAESRAKQAESRAEQAESKAEQAYAASLQSAAQLEAVHNSSSWRITAPLRFLRKSLRRSKGSQADNTSLGSAGFSLKATGRFVLAHGVAYAKSSPRFKRFALGLLNRMPRLNVKLRQMHLSSRPSANWSVGTTTMNNGMSVLSGNSASASGYPRPSPSGVNAQQRSPLEAHFDSYEARE